MLMKTERCKYCHHSNHYVGELINGVCGNCADEFRQEAAAERYADFLPYLDEIEYDLREEAAYAVADKANDH